MIVHCDKCFVGKEWIPVSCVKEIDDNLYLPIYELPET